jgi:hypothetical protein
VPISLPSRHKEVDMTAELIALVIELILAVAKVLEAVSK